MKKRQELENCIFSQLPKNTKFKFGVYSDEMFFYYATYKKTSFELGFCISKNCTEFFPTENIENILDNINYNHYFSFTKFDK